MKLIPDVSTFVKNNRERNANPKASMHSLELVLTVVLFVLLGRFIDTRLDTSPIFTLILSFIGIVGSFLSAYYRYEAVSKKMDKDKVWNKKAVKKELPPVVEDSDELIVPKGYGKDE